MAGALDQALCVLNNSGPENAYRGLLMFSDSIPEKQDMIPDFNSIEQDGYINKGLRFAEFYTYTDEFTPKVRIVDRNGNLAENGKNDSSFGSLEDILSEDAGEVINRIREIVGNILYQTSVMS